MSTSGCRDADVTDVTLTSRPRLRQVLYAKSVDQRSQTFERSLAVGKEYIKQTKGLILRAAIQASQIAVRVSGAGSNLTRWELFPDVVSERLFRTAAYTPYKVVVRIFSGHVLATLNPDLIIQITFFRKALIFFLSQSALPLSLYVFGYLI